MSSAAAVTLIATVLAVQGPSAQIDGGAASGLRAGDRGDAYYQLRVNGTYTRISVGGVEVMSVAGSKATIRSIDHKSLRPGFQVEFRLPEARTKEPEPAGEAEPSQKSTVQLQPQGQPEMIVVPAGTYAIGVPFDAARYYNEVPRFHRRLGAFEVDRTPKRPPATGVTYEDAAASCRRRNARLPTEFEWEVAVGRGAVAAGDPPLEWTASWYLPYPGNEHPEPEYGHVYRVVRGGVSTGEPQIHERHYFRPGAHNLQIGYRCAREVMP